MNNFVTEFNAMAKQVHDNAKDHGWWLGDRNDAELIALMHSELSEALEALRQGDPRDEHLPEHFSLDVELADCIIRIMDMAAHHGLAVAEAIVAKHEYNKTRPHKHGKAF